MAEPKYTTTGPQMHEAAVLLSFGGVLVLIALVGGGFTIREVSLPDVPLWARGVSGVLGLSMTATGWLLAVRGSNPAPSDQLLVAQLPEDDDPDEPGETAPETAEGPYESFTTATDATGQIAFVVPSEWTHRRDNGWFPSGIPEFPGDLPIGPGVNAAPNVEDWRAEEPVPGVFVGASAELAEGYTASELAESMSFTGCARESSGPWKSLERDGHQVIWRCGDDGQRWHVLAFTPVDGDFLVYVEAHIRQPRDLDAWQQLVSSLEVAGADCEPTPERCA